MYYIAICDDEVSTCSEIESMILEYIEGKCIQAEVMIWFSGVRLQRHLRQEQRMDLIFLDIELAEHNGVAVGHFIRNELNDEKTYIVYVSSKQHYAMSLFKTRPFDFLVKPIEQKQINEVLEKVFLLTDKGEDFFQYQFGQSYFKVALEDIIYFQSEGKKIRIVLLKEERKFYGKLKEITGRLRKDFLPIHQSYLINKKHVKKYTYELVEMINGDILTISKAKRKETRQQILLEQKKENDI